MTVAARMPFVFIRGEGSDLKSAHQNSLVGIDLLEKTE